jgi:hypothetical protein
MRRFLAQRRLRSGSICGRGPASTTWDGGAYGSARPDDEPRFRDERFARRELRTDLPDAEDEERFVPRSPPTMGVMGVRACA